MVQGKDVGDALVEPALAPIRAASTRLRDGAVVEGIAGFAKAPLMAGLKEGIQNAASRVGFPTSEVEKLLAWDTLLPALDRIDAAQTRALNAYQAQSSRVGGLLTGLSRGTAVDLYRESGALALGNVAKRFIRDKDLCEPLEALAAEIGTWEALVAQCGDLLECSPLVARSLKRRRIKRIAMGLGAILAISITSYILWSKKQVNDARARVDAAIADQDPCKVESISTTDSPYATPDQVKRKDERLDACMKIRAIAAREAACETLAQNFAAGKLTPEDKIQAKTAADLLERAVKLDLKTEDLLRTPQDMPCQDTPAAKRFFGTYAKAIAGSTSAWTNASRVSDDLRKALQSKDLETVTAWRDELNRQAEPQASKAILSGKPDDMARAKSMCDFHGSFGVEPGKKCAGLLAIMAKYKR